MTKHVYFVNNVRKNEIDGLRKQAYKNAAGFAVDLTTLQWKASDDESHVMAAEDNGQIVSTMRGEIITEMSLLEQKLECPWSFPLEINMPVLLLSRAATLFSHRAVGLNLILRYWFIQFAIHHQIQFVLGTFISGSPRENTLRAMGYHFFENNLGWQQSTYKSLRPVNVVALNLKTHGEVALDFCRDRLRDGIREYSFDDEFPELRFVTSL